jgi:hypothetical protein
MCPCWQIEPRLSHGPSGGARSAFPRPSDYHHDGRPSWAAATGDRGMGKRRDSVRLPADKSRRRRTDGSGQSIHRGGQTLDGSCGWRSICMHVCGRVHILGTTIDGHIRAAGALLPATVHVLRAPILHAQCPWYIHIDLQMFSPDWTMSTHRTWGMHMHAWSIDRSIVHARAIFRSCVLKQPAFLARISGRVLTKQRTSEPGTMDSTLPCLYTCLAAFVHGFAQACCRHSRHQCAQPACERSRSAGRVERRRSLCKSVHAALPCPYRCRLWASFSSSVGTKRKS